MARLRLRLVVSLAALTAATGLAAPASGPASPDARAEATKRFPTPKRAELKLVKTPFGKVIHETKSGLVAYLFTRDKRNRSRCRGDCAKAWPPIKTKLAPKAGKGIRAGFLGTTRRPGGAKMVTYRGSPLYFYEHDSPGRILCHDVAEFGGQWFVVKRNGKRA